MRNKSIGNEIVNSDSIYDEIRKLDNEKDVMERKKYKLQEKTDRVYEAIAKSELKL